MKNLIIVFLFFGSLQLSRAQSTHDLIVSGAQDLIKNHLCHPAKLIVLIMASGVESCS